MPTESLPLVRDKKGMDFYRGVNREELCPRPLYLVDDMDNA
jgi:hypothetical protein